MFEIQEHHASFDAGVVDKPEAGTGNLTNAIAAVASLAAGMIHDFRNPLGTIRSVSEILLDVDVNAAQFKATFQKYAQCCHSHAGIIDGPNRFTSWEPRAS